MIEERIQEVSIETITACNRRCGYCPNSKYDRGLIQNRKTMDDALFVKVIDELAEIKTVKRVMPHLYGEPLLDNRLPVLISYIRKKLPEVRIELYTNGDFLMVSKYTVLIQAGVNHFVISEHGPEMRIRLAEILKYREENGTNGTTIDVRIYREGGILYNRAGLIGSGGFSPNKTCNQPSYSVIIDYQGNVKLCCNDYRGAAIFGNLTGRNLIEIWNSERYTRIRKEVREGVFNLDMCRRCGTIPVSVNNAY